MSANIVRSWWVRGALALLVVVLGAVLAWWFLIRSTAEPATEPLPFRDGAESNEPTPGTGAARATATEVSEAESSPGAADPSDGYVRYVIVPEHPSVEGRTEAWYLAGETLARVGVPSTAKGTTTDVSGSFVIGPDGLDPNAVSEVVVGLASLTSDESRRDQRVREALEVDRYPTATFRIEEIVGWPGEIPEGVDVEFQIRGTMDLHGVQRSLTWDVVARRRGDVITALATTRFRYDDFDIPRLNIAGFVSVEEDVTVQIQVIAVAEGG